MLLNKLLSVAFAIIAIFLLKDKVKELFSSIRGNRLQIESNQKAKCQIGAIGTDQILPYSNFIGSLVCDKTVDVKFNDLGYIEEINGSLHVKEGDVIVRFASNIKKAEMQRCKAQYEITQYEYEILLEQEKNGIETPKSQIIKAKLKSEQYYAEYMRALADYERASCIKACFDAELGIPTKSVGSYVSHGERIISYASTVLVAQFFVSQSSLHNIIIGKEVLIRFDNGHVAKGKIIRRDVVQDEQHETVVRCEIFADDLPFIVQPKMTVRISVPIEVFPNFIHMSVLESAVIVPNEQDMRDRSRKLYVIVNGKIMSVEVDILGVQNGKMSIQGKGLKPGMLYVIDGSNNAIEGKEVDPYDRESNILLKDDQKSNDAVSEGEG